MQQYIHFTDKHGARQIKKSGILLGSTIINGVYAVAVGGANVPEVQQTKLGRAKNRNYAVYFTTNILPDYCFPEECVWKLKNLPVFVTKITHTSAAVKDLDNTLTIDKNEYLEIPMKQSGGNLQKLLSFLLEKELY